MKRLSRLFKRNYLFLVVTLFLSPAFLLAQNSFFLQNGEHNISQRAVVKINEMGNELYGKTNVGVYAVSRKSIDNKSISLFIEETTQNLINPYIVLILITDSKILRIVNSAILDDKFNKEKILSPFSFSGSIIPLLAGKDNDKFSAAILNGYADIVEQVAKSYKVELDSAIGNANLITLNVLRFIFYGTMIIAILFYIYRKAKLHYEKK